MGTNISNVFSSTVIKMSLDLSHDSKGPLTKAQHDVCYLVYLGSDENIVLLADSLGVPGRDEADWWPWP